MSVDSDFDKMTAIDRLVVIMTMLRDKQHGCPWDLEQTIKSLLPYTLEEVYEVADAIENNDLVELEDELGDSIISGHFLRTDRERTGCLRFSGYCERRSVVNCCVAIPMCSPMVIWRNLAFLKNISADQVVVNWEAIKEVEREEKRKKGGKKASQQLESLLDDVPRALPAMERARKLQKRAAQVGFDWAEIGPVLEKLKEEVQEFEEALASGDSGRMSDELGDVLFAAVNLARHSKIEPEVALQVSQSPLRGAF